MAKRKSVLIAGLALGSTLGAACATAQTARPEAAPAREAAERALRNYGTEVLKQADAQRLGFKTLGELQVARLGEPLPVFIIGLTNLKAYKRGAEPSSVLTDARTMLFPVLVDGEVRAQLEVIEKEGRWLAGEFGRPRTARETLGGRDALPRALERVGAEAGARVTLVRIPVLFAELFFVHGSSGDFLVPVRTAGLPSGLEAGRAYAAEALLQQLAEAVQSIDERTVR